MRQLYFLIPALVLSQVIAHAKGTADAFATGIYVNGAFPHFNGQSSVLANSNSRLIAKTYLKYSNSKFVAVDSNTYTYSAGRGGFTDIEQPNDDQLLSFDESYTYAFNIAASAYDNLTHRTQAFDSYEKVTRLTYGNWRSTGWKDTARYVYEYNSANHKMSKSNYQIWYGGFWSDHGESIINYDNNNNITSMNSANYTVDFVYDNNNNLLTMTDEVWDHASSSLVKNERKNYTYTGTNIATYQLEKWDASAAKWTNSEYWTYTYTGNDVKDAVKQTWNGGTWVNALRNTYTYDNNHNRLTETRESWDAGSGSFVNALLTSYTYNSYNQATVITTSSWDNNNSAWIHTAADEEMHFYYEYYAPTIVNNFNGTDAMELKLYPVPARDNISITFNTNSAASFNIALFDTKGSILQQWHDNSTGQYTKSIDVSSLPAGNYFVSIKGEAGHITKQFSIVR